MLKGLILLFSLLAVCTFQLFAVNTASAHAVSDCSPAYAVRVDMNRSYTGFSGVKINNKDISAKLCGTDLKVEWGDGNLYGSRYRYVIYHSRDNKKFDSGTYTVLQEVTIPNVMNHGFHYFTLDEFYRFPTSQNASAHGISGEVYKQILHFSVRV